MAHHLRYAAVAAPLTAMTVLAGCAAFSTDDSVMRAEERVRVARADDSLRNQASGPLADAAWSLAQAVRANNSETQRHFAYLTERNLDLAEATIARQQAEQELAATGATAPTVASRVPLPAVKPVASDGDPGTETAASSGAAEPSEAAVAAERKRLDMAVSVAREARARAGRIEEAVAALESRLPKRRAGAAADAGADRDAEDRKRLDMAIREARDAQARARELEDMVAALRSAQAEASPVTTVPEIRFADGSAELSPGARRRLDPFIARLRDREDGNIIVEGYSDRAGSREESLEISLDRAEAVAAYLFEKGVAADRIQTLGLGDRYPVASNDTAMGRQQNRRVEILVNPAPENRKTSR